jgi:hypothetical protein
MEGLPNRVAPSIDRSSVEFDQTVLKEVISDRPPTVGRSTCAPVVKTRESLDIELATEFFALSQLGQRVVIMDEVHKATPQREAGLASRIEVRDRPAAKFYGGTRVGVEQELRSYLVFCNSQPELARHFWFPGSITLKVSIVSN